MSWSVSLGFLLVCKSVSDGKELLCCQAIFWNIPRTTTNEVVCHAGHTDTSVRLGKKKSTLSTKSGTDLCSCFDS